ncbi:MAG: 3-phosphoshikimate 1-carboxyvinyltransferase, partial [Candidatus Omnitrophota bacterium]|nr:3-phosphoshikimate 1-carboxyvinyltransferase [Candidatus Omnitrophota bacterium]
MGFTLRPAKKLSGSLTLPGDKSISHRAVMLGSIADGTTTIKNILHSDDTETTISAFRALGIDIKEDEGKISIIGKGLSGLSAPASELFMRNSGTSMRILMGILAGQPFQTTLTADEGLSKRPMGRVTEPLSLMGATIEGQDNGNFAPITIQGGKLKAIDHVSKVASAQVKSAILLAGLYADGTTSVTEPSKSRDHTERMLQAFGAKVSVNGLKVSIEGGARLNPQEITIPGDISSAAFFMVGASIVKGSKITLKSVGLNPTRSGVIDILKRMGAKITIENRREVASEPVGDIIIESSQLRGITIAGELVPRSIDELPVVMIAAAYAEGMTIIKGAKELRVKETDRIKSISANLNEMGGKIGVKGDDIIIEGTGNLKGIAVQSFGDHRTAMSILIAGLAAHGETTIDDTACINKSYPDFIRDLESL